MNGVGGSQQPVNIGQVNNNNGVQQSNKAQGSFGGLKVISMAVKNFLSSLTSSGSGSSIQSRNITPLPPQITITTARNSSSEGVQKADSSVGKAGSNPAAKQCFAEVDKCLNNFQSTKDAKFPTKHASIEREIAMQTAKQELKTAVDKFNQNVGSDQQLNVEDLKSAIANAPQGDISQEELATLPPDIQQDVKTMKHYEAMKNAFLSGPG